MTILYRSATVSFLALLFLYSPAHACFEANDSFDVDASELIETAKSIYRVRLRSAIAYDPISDNNHSERKSLDEIVAFIKQDTPATVIYSFEVVSTYRGQSKSELSIELPLRASQFMSTDFKSHELSDFWDNPSVGRAYKTSDCSLTTKFDFGFDYLIIDPDKPTYKSFEMILSNQDRWLAAIK